MDPLLAYAITDLAFLSDRNAEITWFTGSDPFMSIKTAKSNIRSQMVIEMKSLLESFEIADALDFILNVGGRWQAPSDVCRYCRGTKKCDGRGNCGRTNVPAYSVLSANMEKFSSFDWPPAPLRKGKGKDGTLGTLYVGLSPYWSKGNRCWNGAYRGESTYLPIPIQVLAFYSLARYIISFPLEGKLIQLIPAPQPGMVLKHPEVIHLTSVIRRFVKTFRTTLKGIPIAMLPSNVVELVILSHMDLPLILEIPKTKLGLHFLVYDLDREAPKNPRGLENLNLLDMAKFYAALGPYFWDFKSIITSLSESLFRPEFRTQVLQILIRFATGITRRNLWDVNDAFLYLKRLTDEPNWRGSIRLPSRLVINQARRALELMR